MNVKRERRDVLDSSDIYIGGREARSEERSLRFSLTRRRKMEQVST